MLLAALLITAIAMLAACGGVEFKIEFMVDGEIYDTVTTSGEETIKIPENPTKEGYTFAGWYIDSALTQSFDLNTKINNSFTLYAKWDVKSFSIFFNIFICIECFVMHDILL